MGNEKKIPAATVKPAQAPAQPNPFKMTGTPDTTQTSNPTVKKT